jgi:hypothetical protein
MFDVENSDARSSERCPVAINLTLPDPSNCARRGRQKVGSSRNSRDPDRPAYF